MSTPPKPSYKIIAKNIGPIFHLESDLTKNSQHLVFARNGTGKSFLSRAFRFLDQHKQHKPIDNAPAALVSEETADGSADFQILSGDTALGSLSLNSKTKLVQAECENTIFHVFSEDFVESELREKSFEIDGQIDEEISIGSDKNELDDAKSLLNERDKKLTKQRDDLQAKYNLEKKTLIIERGKVNRQLREYGQLSAQNYVEGRISSYADQAQKSSEILTHLERLKSIPDSYEAPINPELPNLEDADLEGLNKILEKVTSPAAIAAEIKSKIDTHKEFFETGTQILRDTEKQECPFCEQDISNQTTKNIIDAYVKYFGDAEAKHKNLLREYYKLMLSTQKSIARLTEDFQAQKSRFDALKTYLPSHHTVSLDDYDDVIIPLSKKFTEILGCIESKANRLSEPILLPPIKLDEAAQIIQEIHTNNAKKNNQLVSSLERSDEERKRLQRELCKTFEPEFTLANKHEIDELNKQIDAVAAQRKVVSDLEKTGLSTKAKDRVAVTFKALLAEFFASKYVFDAESFTIKRGSQKMHRGAQSTLSDGEKSALAFCYYIACIHRKVLSNSDYKNIYLVIDDPVTSMSYDFVFSIAQALKNLTISEDGDVSTNPLNKTNNKYRRPQTLIFTHSSYFFNIAQSNKIVEKGSAFCLTQSGDKHEIKKLEKYIAPFESQLRDIYSIASGGSPDHTTGNAVRSVLEAIGRFCRPDKTKSLTDFISHLAGNDGIMLRSVLINNLSHGSYMDYTPSPEDLILACSETLEVVQKYAPGQLDLIRGENN